MDSFEFFRSSRISLKLIYRKYAFTFPNVPSFWLERKIYHILGNGVIYNALKKTLIVLDEYGYEAFGDAWDGMVSDHITTMSGRYRNLTNPDRDLQDYGGLPAGVGYLFMYAAGHAELVACVLEKAYGACGYPVFNKKEIRVASIGGGPGSELLGAVCIHRIPFCLEF